MTNALKTIAPPFNADRLLKTKLSSSLWTDSNDFLFRTKIILEETEYLSLSFNSKICVDILMAIECDLKSLIISLSHKNESPEDAYLVARKKGHDIVKLYEEVEKRAKYRLKLLPKIARTKLIDKFVKLTVSNRYKLVTILKVQNEDHIDKMLGLGKYSSVLDINYIDSFLPVPFDLHKIAKQSLDKNLGKIGMKGSEVKKYYDRIKKFEESIGKNL